MALTLASLRYYRCSNDVVVDGTMDSLSSSGDVIGDLRHYHYHPPRKEPPQQYAMRQLFEPLYDEHDDDDDNAVTDGVRGSAASSSALANPVGEIKPVSGTSKFVKAIVLATFTPKAVWRPRIAVHRFGVLFASFRYPFRHFELALVILNAALAVIVVVVEACFVKLGLVLSIWLVEGMVYVVLKPMRLRVVELCCVAMTLLHAGEVSIVIASIYFEQHEGSPHAAGTVMVGLSQMPHVTYSDGESNATTAPPPTWEGMNLSTQPLETAALSLRLLATTATVCFSLACLAAFLIERQRRRRVTSEPDDNENRSGDELSQVVN